MAMMSDTNEAQSWSAEGYATNAGFVPVLGRAVLDLMDPKPGERILDLGCGDGTLTAQIAERGAAVVGVDASPDLLAAAKARGLDARLMDGQRLAFEAEFDAVFSNAALHWMLDQDAVADGVRRALKPGGRFVAECGGHGNIAAIATALADLAGVGPRRLLDDRATKLRTLGQTTPEGREAARREVRELQELQRTLARSLGDLRERLEEHGLPRHLHLPQLPAPVRSRVHIDTSGLPTVERARAELVDRAVRLSAWRRPGESPSAPANLARITPGEKRSGETP